MPGRLVQLFAALLVLTFAPRANAADFHCQPFSTSLNQICVEVAGSVSRIFFMHADGALTLLDQGPIQFLNWSRADDLQGDETAPHGIRNHSLENWGKKTESAQNPIWYFLAGIGDHVLWVRDNGLLAKFPFKPADIKRIDYSSPNTQPLPPTGTERLKQQLSHDHFDLFTFVSKSDGSLGSSDQADHFMVRYSDGKFLHIGPFTIELRKNPIIRDFDHFKTQGVQLCLRQSVGKGWLKYGISLAPLQAQLEIRENLPREFPALVASEASEQLVPFSQISSDPELSSDRHLSGLGSIMAGATTSGPASSLTQQPTPPVSASYQTLELGRLDVLRKYPHGTDLFDTLNHLSSTLAQLILEDPQPNQLSANDLVSIAFSENPEYVRSALKGLAKLGEKDSSAEAKRQGVIQELLHSDLPEIRNLAFVAAKACKNLLNGAKKQPS